MYICPRCHYETNQKSHFIEHLNKKKPCKPEFSNIPSSQVLDELLQEIQNNKKYACDECEKSFVLKSSLARHKKEEHPTINVTITDRDEEIALQTNVDKYVDDNEYPPRIIDWLSSKFDKEHQKLYELLINDRYAFNQKFVVNYDTLSNELGYDYREHIKSFVEDVDYLLDTNTQQIYLTLHAAQKLCSQSSAMNGDNISCFFNKTVEVLHEFQLIYLKYEHNESNIKTRVKALLSIGNKKHLLYIADVGEINGKRVLKHGSTNKLFDRNNALKRIFKKFNLLAIFETPHNREVEAKFKEHDIFVSNQVNVTGNDGSIQTECFIWQENISICKIVKLWKTLDNELSTLKQQQQIHERAMAQIEYEVHKEDCRVRIAQIEADCKVKTAEAETRKAEIELRMLELRIQNNLI
jgi:hypothetical protein